jgi:hypothetical protein
VIDLASLVVPIVIAVAGRFRVALDGTSGLATARPPSPPARVAAPSPKVGDPAH